jgi:diguanylate cyclase (GGDEF)-like protein
VIGANIVSALRQWPELEALIRRGDRVPISFQVKYQKKFLGVNITPLYNREQQITGRLVTWQDITKQLQIEARLEEANQKLRAQLREIKSLQASLEDQVIRDPLTNLLNRRFLEEALPKEVARAQRKEYPVTILIIDIDEFKLVNDTYGHAAGDLILQNLGRLLSKQTRKDDIAVRLGGEEFLILLTEVGLEQGMKRAEDIRRLIEKMRSEVDEFRVGITVSIGVAEFPSSSKEIRDVMRKADQAMYRAKFKGRNQVAR